MSKQSRFATRVHFFCLALLLKCSGKNRRREKSEAIQTASTAAYVQSYQWCMETCAVHVCAFLMSLSHRKREADTEGHGQLWQTPPHHRASRPRGGGLSLCSGSLRVLDPLVPALSDLQVVLSYLIMVQAPWIVKEWLSDTCPTSLARLMESTVGSVRHGLGQQHRGSPHKHKDLSWPWSVCLSPHCIGQQDVNVSHTPHEELQQKCGFCKHNSFTSPFVNWKSITISLRRECSSSIFTAFSGSHLTLNPLSDLGINQL